MCKIAITKRQQLIVNMLTYERLTLNEIMERLNRASSDEFDFNISRSTFCRDVRDIYEIYGIEIGCDNSSNEYYIEADEDIISPAYNARLAESYDIYESLKADKKYRQFILLDNRKVNDSHYLPTILEAIKQCREISFRYHNFEKNEVTERTVKPCFVKEFKYRWYLICVDRELVKVFALERMSHLLTLNSIFDRYSLPDIKRLYRHCFGLNLPRAGETVEKISFTVNAVNRRYLESLPLHWSQKIVDGSGGRSVVKLQLYVTYDFVMELRSMGDIEVMNPKHLAEMIVGAKSNMMKIS